MNLNDFIGRDSLGRSCLALFATAVIAGAGFHIGWRLLGAAWRMAGLAP